MGLIEYLRRPEMDDHRAGLLRRRARYEMSRRLHPDELDRERVVDCAWGLRLSLRPTDVVDRAILLYGVYDLGTAVVIHSLLREGMTAVDVGAHIGQYTLIASRRVGTNGRVIAVEPQAELHDRLTRNASLNQAGNVTALRIALGATDGMVWLNPPPEDRRNAGEAFTSLLPRDGRSLRIQCSRLDTVVTALGLSRLDLVKVDVEGTEATVLEGGVTSLARWHPAVVIELLDVAGLSSGCIPPAVDVLQHMGYSIFGIRLTSPRRWRLVELDDLRKAVSYKAAYCALNVIALHPDVECPRDGAIPPLF